MTAILYCTKRHLPFHSHGVRVSCVSERVNIDSIIRILDLANSRGAIRGCLLCAGTPLPALIVTDLKAAAFCSPSVCAFCSPSVCAFAAVLRLRHAQPKQRNTVRTPRMYRTTAHIAQSHHAERSSEAAKQSRFPAANTRPLQSTPLRGRLGGMGESKPPCFWFFCLTKEHRPRRSSSQM